MFLPLAAVTGIAEHRHLPDSPHWILIVDWSVSQKMNRESVPQFSTSGELCRGNVSYRLFLSASFRMTVYDVKSQAGSKALLCLCDRSAVID
jgi:hypothetical protein